MTPTANKTQIAVLRFQGIGYTDIAKKLSMKTSAVRMYCLRHQLTDEDLAKRSVCINCGAAINQPKKGGRKVFCSERCRSAWRRSNHRLSETTYHHTCESCGVGFETRGNKAQRFCSTSCYRSYRKGGAA